jgi:PAS domain S-box-containing protein
MVNNLSNSDGSDMVPGDLTQCQKELRELKQQRAAEAKGLMESKQALLRLLDDAERERGLAEEERDRTIAIVKNLGDGIVIVEHEKVALTNPKAEAFFDIESAEIMGQDIWSLINHPKLSALIKLLQDYRLDLTKQELVLREDLILEVSTAAIIRGSEEGGKMVILHDITREKSMEKMKTEFVSITAHQLRTPLSAIKWTMNMMLDGDLGPVPEGQRDFLQKTYQSNERMIRLVNDLLNVTRIEEGRFLYDLKPQNIIELTEKIISPLKELAEKKGLKFIFEKASTKVPPIYVDQERFGIALQNLVDNAIHYTMRGRVLVSTAYDGQKEEFYFMIKDDGIGIPSEQQKRVFSRFFRAPNAIKTETEGTGLGLFIAKNIVEAHGGKIWFESEEGKGASFYIMVPRDSRQR